MQINIITLGTDNILTSTVFYSKWFNTKPAAASNENIKFFNLKGVKLALYGRDLLAKDANVYPDGNGFQGITLAINASSKEEVDQIFSNGIICGAKISKKPEMAFWGGYSGYLSDLDGHLWEIAWNPFFKKLENGELDLS